MKARRQKVLTMDGMQSVGAIGKMRVYLHAAAARQIQRDKIDRASVAM